MLADGLRKPQGTERVIHHEWTRLPNRALWDSTEAGQVSVTDGDTGQAQTPCRTATVASLLG